MRSCFVRGTAVQKVIPILRDTMDKNYLNEIMSLSDSDIVSFSDGATIAVAYEDGDSDVEQATTSACTNFVFGRGDTYEHGEASEMEADIFAGHSGKTKKTTTKKVETDSLKSPHNPVVVDIQAKKSSKQSSVPEKCRSFNTTDWYRPMNDMVTELGFKRPSRAVPDDNALDLTLFQFEMESHAHFDQRQRRIRTIVRMYGITEKGVSVMVNVHGFNPYVHILVPPTFTEDKLSEFILHFTRVLMKRVTFNDDTSKLLHQIYDTTGTGVVQSALMERGYNMVGYLNTTMEQTFIKVTLVAPFLVRQVQQVFENNMLDSQYHSFRLFNASLDFIAQYMVNCDMVGCSWITLTRKKWMRVPARAVVSTCQLNVNVDYSDIIAHDPRSDDKWSRVAPLRILSYDIECCGRVGSFPEATIDPVIQIGNVLYTFGDDDNDKGARSCSKEQLRVVFTLGSCSPLDPTTGGFVRSFETEGDMLAAWSAFVRAIDPDLFTGYNIDNFDMPYLITRAQTLDVIGFSFLGRIKTYRAYTSTRYSGSKQMGVRLTKETHINGRISFDLFPIMQRDHKLRSYTLNSVSEHFLQQKKDDVHHSQISILFNGDDNDRRRLAQYCLQDCVLPVQLEKRLCCVINHVEMARVSGVCIQQLLRRGQQIKILNKISRAAKGERLFIPFIGRESSTSATDSVAYEGATVLEPKSGFYSSPICTFDFNSLYPTIMMARNLCYTTLVNERRHLLTPDQYIETPAGHFFVTADVRPGLLPAILQQLVQARTETRTRLAKTTDSNFRAVLNGRQLALKVMANSVYGFTGALRGYLPCLEISSSVTSFGRSMIEQTRDHVESRYSDCTVVYGDTDSVMVKFNPQLTTVQLVQLAQQITDGINGLFPRPIRIEFEKIFHPFLLMSKKRYVGIQFPATVTDTLSGGKMDSKGLETVRRDNPPIVRNIIAEMLRILMYDKNPDGAMQYVKTQMDMLMRGEYDIEQLIVSKQLTKLVYKNKQPHGELLGRMAKRRAEDGADVSLPTVGDRIQYVIVAGPGPIFNRSECPEIVKRNNIPIDEGYYCEWIANAAKRVAIYLIGDVATNEFFQQYVEKSKKAKTTSLQPMSVVNGGTKVSTTKSDDRKRINRESIMSYLLIDKRSKPTRMISPVKTKKYIQTTLKFN